MDDDEYIKTQMDRIMEENGDYDPDHYVICRENACCLVKYLGDVSDDMDGEVEA